MRNLMIAIGRITLQLALKKEQIAAALRGGDKVGALAIALAAVVPTVAKALADYVTGARKGETGVAEDAAARHANVPPPTTAEGVPPDSGAHSTTSPVAGTEADVRAEIEGLLRMIMGLLDMAEKPATDGPAQRPAGQ